MSQLSKTAHANFTFISHCIFDQVTGLTAGCLFPTGTNYYQQEYIPERCVPSAAVAVSGGCLVPGGLLARGVCSRGGLSAPGGVWSQGVSPCWGVSALGGVCSGGRCLLRGGIPSCTEADNSTHGQTDACKNITFATSLRTVKIHNRSIYSCCL